MFSNTIPYTAVVWRIFIKVLFLEIETAYRAVVMFSMVNALILTCGTSVFTIFSVGRMFVTVWVECFHIERTFQSSSSVVHISWYIIPIQYSLYSKVLYIYILALLSLRPHKAGRLSLLT